MPVSQMRAVSSRAHVGSPLAFPWPNTCRERAGGLWAWSSSPRPCEKPSFSGAAPEGLRDGTEAKADFHPASWTLSSSGRKTQYPEPRRQTVAEEPSGLGSHSDQ